MGEILAVLQDHFSIRADLQIDFATEAGDLHSGRVIFALKKHGLEASIGTLSLLCERIDKTPATGAKLVDALIVEIQAAAEGETVPAPAPTSFAGCELCHDGIVVLPFPNGNRAVYCDCGRGQFLWNANDRKSMSLVNRMDLKAKAFGIRREEIARSGSTLIRMGIDPEAPDELRQKQFRAWIVGMKARLGRELAQGSQPEPPRKPPSREQAEKALASVRKPAKPNPPPQLNPEALALAAYDNGDERNDWE
jgi:hypothetical protein